MGSFANGSSWRGSTVARCASTMRSSRCAVVHSATAALAPTPPPIRNSCPACGTRSVVATSGGPATPCRSSRSESKRVAKSESAHSSNPAAGPNNTGRRTGICENAAPDPIAWSRDCDKHRSCSRAPHTRQRANWTVLDLVLRSDFARHFLFIRSTAIQVHDRSTGRLDRLHSACLHRLAELLRVRAEVFQLHLVRPQLALKPQWICDLPQRAAKDHSVESAQHTADRVVIRCDKLLHAFLLVAKCFWTTHNDTLSRNALILVAATGRARFIRVYPRLNYFSGSTTTLPNCSLFSKYRCASAISV